MQTSAEVSLVRRYPAGVYRFYPETRGWGTVVFTTVAHGRNTVRAESALQCRTREPQTGGVKVITVRRNRQTGDWLLMKRGGTDRRIPLK